MKCKMMLYTAFTSAILLSTCSLTAYADATDTYTLSPEIQKAAEECIVASSLYQDTGVATYAVSGGEVSGSSEITSFDTSKGYSIYYMAFFSKDHYQAEEGFTSLLSETPDCYVIPYENEDEGGLLYLREAENGSLSYGSGECGQKGIFDLAQVESVAAQLDGVTEIRLVKEITSAINLVYIATEEGEYIVPYAQEHIMGFYPDLQFGEIYTADDFMSWVCNAFDWESRNSDSGEIYAGSALPEYVGYEITPVKPSSEANLPIRLGISGLGFVAAGSLAVYGTKTLKKKKNS